MHRPLTRWSIAAACTAILWSMGAAQAAERKLADFQPFSALVPAGFTCRPDVTVTVRVPDETAFTNNRVELQKLVGGVRAILGFECPNTAITNLLIVGEAGGKEVYRGAASGSGNWLLADLRSATTSPPAEQTTVPEQGSVPKEAAAPEQPPRETAKAGLDPTLTPHEGQKPSGIPAPAPAGQAPAQVAVEQKSEPEKATELRPPISDDIAGKFTYAILPECNRAHPNPDKGVGWNVTMAYYSGLAPQDLQKDLTKIYRRSFENVSRHCREKRKTSVCVHRGGGDGTVCLVDVELSAAGNPTGEVSHVNRRFADIATLLKQANVESAVDVRELDSNPFPYKGRRVVAYGVWSKMLSETEAYLFPFGYEAYGVVVAGMEPSAFKQERACLIALEVNGKRTLQGLSRAGPALVTEVTYIDQWTCPGFVEG